MARREVPADALPGEISALRARLEQAQFRERGHGVPRQSSHYAQDDRFAHNPEVDAIFREEAAEPVTCPSRAAS